MQDWLNRNPTSLEAESLITVIESVQGENTKLVHKIMEGEVEVNMSADAAQPLQETMA